MKTILRWSLSLLLLTLLIAQPATAYDYPLSSEAIRQAYFLGKGDPTKRHEFFEKYTKRYPTPKSGQYVGLIEFQTPYVLIAQQVSENVATYFAPDAEQQFLGKPAVCRMIVDVYWGYNSSQAPLGENYRYQTDYAFRLKQDDKEIPIKSKWMQSILSGESAPVDVGMEFDMEYDADKINSAPTTIEITGPDKQTLVETFDLDSLR